MKQDIQILGKPSQKGYFSIADTEGTHYLVEFYLAPKARFQENSFVEDSLEIVVAHRVQHSGDKHTIDERLAQPYSLDFSENIDPANLFQTRENILRAYAQEWFNVNSESIEEKIKNEEEKIKEGGIRPTLGMLTIDRSQRYLGSDPFISSTVSTAESYERHMRKSYDVLRLDSSNLG